jgi:hypothetical protein
MAKIQETWLTRWVTARCLRHQRSGTPDRNVGGGVASI